ncbi:hypothetical protein K457DRAFT_125938 [Linnemannia elongata AG-77]|uniref:Kazal-like domain-containing protein n=1 Tax=Linnemannia elongata AG-77 TaxID=1314771 RepID=A0A197JW23_9FUNG|nr:hypothetical protein K457DRAFT_125938 [Linnemannia elongata AG-77]
MHSTMMYPTTLALLVFILSFQVQVHASPISISAAVQERRGDMDTGTLLARAEGTAAKLLTKRADKADAIATTTTAGKQEPGTADTSSKKCPENCFDIYEPYCATNSNGHMKRFSNKCFMKKHNCDHPNDTYEHNIECSPSERPE